MSETIEPNSGALSQSSVASFVFSSIQVAISSIIFAISMALQDALSGIAGSRASSSLMTSRSTTYEAAVTLSGFGILGFLIAFVALGSIMTKGKTGFGLTMCSMLMSFTCIAINFYPLVMMR